MPGVGEELVPFGFPGPAPRQVQGEAAGRGRDPRRDRDQGPADGGGRHPGQMRAGEGGGGAGEIERHHQPGTVGDEPPRRQVCERGALRVGVDLLDDRVPAVNLVRGHGVQDGGVGGGEERVEPPGPASVGYRQIVFCALIFTQREVVAGYLVSYALKPPSRSREAR